MSDLNIPVRDLPTARERLSVQAREGFPTSPQQLQADIVEVLSLLQVPLLRRTETEPQPRITIHGDARLPEGYELSPLSYVRFSPPSTDPAQGSIEAYMPQTRDQGWVEILARRPTVQLRNGSLMLRASDV